MAYHIDSWETIDCSITIPLSEIGSHLIGDADHRDDGSVYLTFNEYASMNDAESWGIIEGDTFVFREIRFYGENSSSQYENFVEWIKKSKGRLEAAIVWDNSSIEHMLIMDGEDYSWHGSAAELIKTNTELRLAAE